MRFFTTILLILCTTGLSYWLVVDINDQLREPSIDENGAIIPGNKLFDRSAIEKRDSISISKEGHPEHIIKLNRNQIWEYVAPFKDRASGILYMGNLLTFTKEAEVIEVIPLNEVNLDDYKQLNDDWIKIKVKDIHNQVVASYKIGMDSSWLHRVVGVDETGKEVSQNFPCIYVIKEDVHTDNMLYLVADPTLKIRSLFANDFEGFRDHRPFALNRKYMEEISIKQSNSEIVIDHTTPEAEWLISKPLDLAMDPKALTSLLVNISNLQAVKIHPSGSVTLPTESKDLKEISVKNFGTDERVTLTIYPPAEEKTTATTTAATTYATISNRDVIFELPTRPLSGYKSSVASIPTSVNELRARNMINLNRANVRGFVIRQRTKPPIIISRPAAGSNYELLSENSTPQAPNDVSIANLIAVVSKEPVKDFVTDAVVDLRLYNLQDPTLVIDILPLSGSRQTLLFSRKDETIYAYLQGGKVVWEVDQEAFLRIPRNESEWKSNNVWNLIKNDIIQFSIHQRGGKKITVNYDYLADTANALIGEQNADNQLNPIQAKFFIHTNAQLNARRRLGPHNTQAMAALKNPIARVTITNQLFDELAMPSETITHTLTIAKPSETAKRIAYYYAKSSNDPDYFTISPATYHQLMVDVFSEE